MIEVESKTCVLFADIGCPWAHVAVHRWRAERSARGLDGEVGLELRAFPLELFNEQATPKRTLDAEVPVAGGLAPKAGWLMWQRQTYDYAVTTLPALEAVRAARIQSRTAAEELDSALRRAFFGESRNISLMHIILEVAGEVEDVDASGLEANLRSGAARKSIFEDMETAENSDVKGSPHFFLPDGSSWHNPGIQMHWEGKAGQGIPVIDKDDPGIYAEMFDRLAES